MAMFVYGRKDVKRSPLQRKGPTAEDLAFRSAVLKRACVTPSNVPPSSRRYRCAYCKFIYWASQVQAHHHTMRSASGSNDPKNGWTLCDGPTTKDCHGRIHRHEVDDWHAWLNVRKHWWTE